MRKKAQVKISRNALGCYDKKKKQIYNNLQNSLWIIVDLLNLIKLMQAKKTIIFIN